MKNICLINVFLGEFPWYFNFFLKSCSTNPSIDFLIFTDQKAPENTPANVRFVPFSLSDFNYLAAEKLYLVIDVKYAYKLCDFKPAYGIIFSEYLKNYEYWGITDIDVIFGRIREFITDEMLDEYEVISVRNDYPTGSFMIFKNNTKINNLFRRSKDHHHVFTSQKHYCFDECNFVHGYLEEGGDIFEIETEIESMHHVLLKEMKDNNLHVHFDFLIIEGLPGQLFWDNGILSFKNEFEVLFYHLILYKDNLYSFKPEWKHIPQQFHIDKYLIRSQNIFSKLYFLFFEKIKIWLLHKILSIESLLSCNLYQAPVRNINQSSFLTGNQRRFIAKDSIGNNSLSYHSLNNPPISIFKSFFRKNIFFIKGFYPVYYRLSEDNKSLYEIKIDGNILKLTLEE